MDKVRVERENRWHHGHDIPCVDRPPHVPVSLGTHGGSGSGCPVVETETWAPECVEIADVEFVSDWSVPMLTDGLHMAKGGVRCSEGMPLDHETS